MIDGPADRVSDSRLPSHGHEASDDRSDLQNETSPSQWKLVQRMRGLVRWVRWTHGGPCERSEGEESERDSSAVLVPDVGDQSSGVLVGPEEGDTISILLQDQKSRRREGRTVRGQAANVPPMKRKIRMDAVFLERAHPICIAE